MAKLKPLYISRFTLRFPAKSCFFQANNIFYMVRVWEHIDGFYGFYLVICRKQLQIPGLRGRVAAHINYALRIGKKNGFYHIGMHPCPWGIRNDDIWSSMLGDKFFREHILHVTGKERGILNSVEFRIDSSILYGIFNIFNANNLFAHPCNEVGNGSCSRV